MRTGFQTTRTTRARDGDAGNIKNKNPIQIFLQIIIHQRTELGCHGVVVGLGILEHQYYHNSSNIGTGYNTKTDRHTHLQETVITVHTLINTHTHKLTILHRQVHSKRK